MRHSFYFFYSYFFLTFISFPLVVLFLSNPVSLLHASFLDLIRVTLKQRTDLHIYPAYGTFYDTT